MQVCDYNYQCPSPVASPLAHRHRTLVCVCGASLGSGVYANVFMQFLCVCKRERSMAVPSFHESSLFYHALVLRRSRLATAGT